MTGDRGEQRSIWTKRGGDLKRRLEKVILCLLQCCSYVGFDARFSTPYGVALELALQP